MAVPKSRKSRSKVKTKRCHIKMQSLPLTKSNDGKIHIRHFNNKA